MCSRGCSAQPTGYDQLLDCAVAVLEWRHASLDKRLKLTSIQVPPFAISPAVDVGAFSWMSWMSWVSPDLPLLQNDLGDYALVFERQVNFINRLWGLQTKKVFVKGSVFHCFENLFVKLNFAGVDENSYWNR